MSWNGNTSSIAPFVRGVHLLLVDVLFVVGLNKQLSKHSWVAGDLRYQDTSVTLQIIQAHVGINQNVIGAEKADMQKYTIVTS